MTEPAGRGPTYDGSLWGPDVCRCGNHVDPHRHTEADPDGKSIYDENDEPDAGSTEVRQAHTKETPTWLAVTSLSKAQGQLERIASWHSRETAEGGMVGDYCIECGELWPCDTRRMADGSHEDLTT